MIAPVNGTVVLFGVPVTVNVAEAPAAIVVDAGCVTVKPVAPVTTILVKAADPVFLIVNVYGVAATFITDDPTEIAGVLLLVTCVTPFKICNVGVGADVPVTETFNVNGDETSFDAIVIAPVNGTVVLFGVPVTVNVAEAPAAIVVDAGCVTVKPVAPVTTILVKAADPVFLIVNVYGVAATFITDDPTEIEGVLFVTRIVAPSNTCNAGAAPVTVTFTT